MLVSADGGHPWVAEKKLIRAEIQTDHEFEISYQLEANVLKVMKSLDDRHLIRTVASYRTSRDHYFLFPWAELGSLRDYWEKTNEVDPFDLKKRLAPPYLQWVFTQLHGVAHAITLLHDLVILHGDLKPENILCFPNSGIKSDEDPCTLVIADAGLSKMHNLATHLRSQKTAGPKGSTVAYEPPEAEIQSNERTSRRYDVWSMGCICLQFLVWLVEGQNGLNEFHRGLAPFRGRFYELIYDEKDYRRVIDARLHLDVVNKIKSLRNRRSFQGEGNPLGSLVDIIDKHMLVPHLHLVNTKAPVGKKAETLSVPQPMTGANRTLTMNASESSPGVRMTSDTMVNEFVKILQKKNSFKIPSAALDGSETIQPSTTPRPEQSRLGVELSASGVSGAATSGRSSAGSRVSWLESLGVRRRRR
jgi:serine/threonine protein kinase